MTTQNELQLDQVVMDARRLDGPDAPRRIFIAPWGEVKTASGAFVLDEQSAAAIIAAFNAHGTDVPVDYEHQTLGGGYSSPSGQAPAAGWIKALSVVTPKDVADGADALPGLWAEVEWTAEGAARLESREYRYLSPVAMVRRADRRMIALHSVALTNKPAIIGMRPVISATRSADGREPGERLRDVLALEADEPMDCVLVAAADRIDSLQQQEARRAAEELVARAMSAGKLIAAQRDWAIALALRDPAGFTEWESSAPVVVPLGRMAAHTRPRVSGGEAGARQEWRANRSFLEKLCTEDAYAACAVRNED